MSTLASAVAASGKVNASDRLTVRVGCHLIYETEANIPMLLDVQPHLGAGQTLKAEQLAIGNGLVAEPIKNSHGNRLVRLILPLGKTDIRHDALVEVPTTPDVRGVEHAAVVSPLQVPPELLRYMLPSRYCESDKLAAFAWETFGQLEPGWPRIRAISNWVHAQIEYRFGSGGSDLSAWDIFQRRYGVCRDFAHLTIALCRALNVPARYVTGHLPDIGYVDPGTPMDFHAYSEVYLGNRWFAIDARFNVPRIGRVKISHGRDAVDCAFGTTFGPVNLSYFEVWAYQVESGTVNVGDPVDLSLRLDGALEVRFKKSK